MAILGSGLLDQNSSTVKNCQSTSTLSCCSSSIKKVTWCESPPTSFTGPAEIGLFYLNAPRKEKQAFRLRHPQGLANKWPTIIPMDQSSWAFLFRGRTPPENGTKQQIQTQQTDSSPVRRGLETGDPQIKLGRPTANPIFFTDAFGMGGLGTPQIVGVLARDWLFWHRTLFFENTKVCWFLHFHGPLPGLVLNWLTLLYKY